MFLNGYWHVPSTLGSVAAALTLTTALSVASPLQALELEEAVQAAINYYPEINESRANLQALRQDENIARSRFLPTVTLSAESGREFTNTSTIVGTGEYLNRYQANLNVNQLIFNGFAREKEVDRQVALGRAAQLELIDNGETLGLDVVRAYIDLVRNQQLVSLAEDNLATHQEVVADVQTRVDGGRSGIGDLQQAQTREANARATLASALRDLDSSEIIYLRLVGEMPEDEMELPEFDEDLWPGTLDEALEITETSSPLIEAAKASAEGAARNTDVQRSLLMPTVDLDVNLRRSFNLDGTRGKNEEAIGLLRLNWNLFNGGGDLAAIREARARHSEALATTNRLRKEVIEDVRQSYSEFERRSQEWEARQDQIISSGATISTYRQEFLIGQRDLLDLLDSENEFFNAESQLLSIETQVLFAQYRLLASMGKLLPALGVTVSEEFVEAATTSE